MNMLNLKTLGKDATKRNNPTAGILFLIVFFVMVVFSWLTTGTNNLFVNILSFVLTPAITYITTLFIIKSFDQPYSLGELFGKLDFNLAVMAIVKLIVMTVMIILWSLLLIIPGIIKGFAYALVPYIAIEQPELSIMDTLKLSEKLMKGHKMDLFGLMLSFIGWFLLTIITCGLVGFYFFPYITYTQLAFYREIKASYATQPVVTN